MSVLTIAGGIILALVLLPFVGPIVAIVFGAAVVIVPVIFIILASIDRKAKKKAEEERLAKLPEKKREAEVQRIRDYQRWFKRTYILPPVITFVVTFLLSLLVWGWDFGVLLVVIPALFAFLSFLIAVCITPK